MVKWSLIGLSMWCLTAVAADGPQSVDYVKQNEFKDYANYYSEQFARQALGCNDPKSNAYKSCQKTPTRYHLEQSAHVNWGGELDKKPPPPTGTTLTTTPPQQTAPQPVAQSASVSPANPLCSATIYLYRNEPTERNHEQVVKVCGHEPPE